jgi:putative DNA primase/helicase
MPINLSNIQEKRGRDFASLKKRAESRTLDIIASLVPACRVRGNHCDMINPTRTDSSFGSFRYDLKSNRFRDYADFEHSGGNGIIDFVIYITKFSEIGAYDYVDQFIGGSQPLTVPISRSCTKKNPWVSIRFPNEIPRMVVGQLNPTHVWTYRDQSGNPILYVCRYLGNEGKFYLPFSYWQKDCGSFQNMLWKRCMPPGFNSLYNLDKIINSNGPVVVCEGEKAADAAMRLLPGFVATTSRNGAGSANKTDWTPLIGREVLIWPDNDDPGSHYANAVKDILPHARILDLSQFGEIFKGWDAADCLAENRKVVV